MKFNFLGTATAAVLGGLASIPDYRGAYILSLCGGIGLLAITLSFKEPTKNDKEDRVNFFKQIVFFKTHNVFLRQHIFVLH